MVTHEPTAVEPGRYLTDGANLFRLLTPAGTPPHGGFIELEDALRLERVLVRGTQLARMRPVAPRATQS